MKKFLITQTEQQVHIETNGFSTHELIGLLEVQIMRLKVTMAQCLDGKCTCRNTDPPVTTTDSEA